MNSAKKIPLIIAIIGLTIKLLSNLLYTAFKIKGVFYIGDAIGWVCVVAALSVLFESYKKKWINNVFIYFLIATLLNLIDEIFSLNDKFSWYEIAYCVVLSILLIFSLWKTYKTRNQP